MSHQSNSKSLEQLAHYALQQSFRDVYYISRISLDQLQLLKRQVASIILKENDQQLKGDFKGLLINLQDELKYRQQDQKDAKLLARVNQLKNQPDKKWYESAFYKWLTNKSLKSLQSQQQVKTNQESKTSLVKYQLSSFQQESETFIPTNQADFTNQKAFKQKQKRKSKSKIE